MSPNAKPTKEVTVITSIRLPKSLVLRIDQRAKGQGVSRNAEIAQALASAYGDTTAV